MGSADQRSERFKLNMRRLAPRGPKLKEHHSTAAGAGCHLLVWPGPEA